MSDPSARQVPLHPVIVGYDGSAAARHALAYAAGMARRIGCPLLVACVVSSGPYRGPPSGQLAVPPCGPDAPEVERWLLAELDQADVAGLSVHVCARSGSPARELAAMAAEHRADALVVGAPAQFWHHVAGSVPGWLAAHARCTVIVVP